MGLSAYYLRGSPGDVRIFPVMERNEFDREPKIVDDLVIHKMGGGGENSFEKSRARVWTLGYRLVGSEIDFFKTMHLDLTGGASFYFIIDVDEIDSVGEAVLVRKNAIYDPKIVDQVEIDGVLTAVRDIILEFREMPTDTFSIEV